MKIGSIADQAGELAFWAMVGILFLSFCLIAFLLRPFNGIKDGDGYTGEDLL